MYEGKKVSPLHLRLLQGVKAKHLLRFEERKHKLDQKKTRKTEILQLKKPEKRVPKVSLKSMNTIDSDMDEFSDLGNA